MPTAGDMRQFLGGQTFGSAFLPKADLSGKTIVVTGANTGLGYACAVHLANLKVSHLILACRNAKKGEDAKSKIYTETNCKERTKIEVWDVDLASYKSVERFGERVRTELERLDGFVANAGVEMTDFELSEGLETTLTVNVVSTILMAITVLPKLRETAGKFNLQTNLSIVGSMVHALGNDKDIDLPESTDILENLSRKETADMAGRYSLSKTLLHEAFHELCNTVSTNHPNDNVVLNIVNPGWCGSDLGRYKQPGLPQRVMFALIGRTSEHGARTLVHAVTAGKDTHGKYLSECRVKMQSEFMRSRRGMELHKRVWEQLVRRLVGVVPESVRLV